jgi:hypothetical protein
MFNEQITRALADGRFEETDEGVLVPSARALIQGVWRYCKRGEPEEEATNMVVTQGRDYLLNAGLKNTGAIPAWYVAPFTGDVTVQASWTAATFASTATEATNYASATRPVWTGGAVAAGAVDSYAAKAEIKSTVNGLILRGAALVSVNTKSATTGTLFAAARFPSAKTLDIDEILDVGYGIQIVVAP